MRTSSDIIRLSLSPLKTDEIKRAKAEAKEIASAKGIPWIDVYYERNLSDGTRHYEANIPKDISYIEFNRMIDELDEQFRERLIGL